MIALALANYIALNNLFIFCLDKGVSIYGGLFHITPYTQLFNIFILIISLIILSLTSFYPRKLTVIPISNNTIKDKIISLYSKIASGENNESFKIIEYPLIIVFVILGALFLMSSSDLISVFLSIELQSYGLYIASTIYRNSEKSTKAGLTYFLLGGLSSCFILLGSSLLYVTLGTSNLEGIYLLTSLYEVNDNLLSLSQVNNLWYKPYYINLSLILISVGFLFKVSAAPFHFWSPDVYDGIPTIVTTFVAILAKISLFIFLLELVYNTSNNTFQIYSWTNCLLISSLASLIIGSFLGLVQTRIKRLYAYSTISHVGFILLGLSVNSVESIQAYLFYIITYTLSNLNAFLILLAIGYSLYSYLNIYDNSLSNNKDIDKNYSPIQLISELKGYFYINPFLAISLSITLFSFVGVPPLLGFFAKQMILSAALDSGYYFMTLISILTSVIGAVYYLSLIKQIFFFKSDYIYNLYNNLYYKFKGFSLKEDKTKEVINIKLSISNALSFTISFITLLLLLFIFIPNEWLNVANILTLLLFKN